MKKTALVIMAAGIGSRFGGGIKQLTPVGPSGETIVDYSIRDAIEAGFDKVVFIIRKDLEESFRSGIGARVEPLIETVYEFQELSFLPEGYKVPEGRTKPWGTGHAVWCARRSLDCPFAVINADDYYGKKAYRLIHDYLVAEHPALEGMLDVCMAGFRLGNTLSDNGSVTRGICSIEEGFLTGVKETHDIFKTLEGAAEQLADGSLSPLPLDCLVSMNMWGLTPAFMDTLEKGFLTFLHEGKEGDIKREYLLPVIIDGLLKDKKARVKVLESEDSWFGVTYQEDREVVREALAALIAQGEYPSRLYESL